MNFSKSRLRRVEQSMVSMGITGKPEIVINILVFEAPKKPRSEKLAREKHVDAEKTRKPPTPQEHMAPEKKRRHKPRLKICMSVPDRRRHAYGFLRSVNVLRRAPAGDL